MSHWPKNYARGGSWVQDERSGTGDAAGPWRWGVRSHTIWRRSAQGRCGYFLAPALLKMWSKGGDRAENVRFAHNRHHPHQTQQTTCPVADLVCCPGFALWGQPRRMQR
eukprot:gene13638-biopygen20055